MGANTVKDLKQRYIDYLMSMDLVKMDVQELGQYGGIIKTLDDMEKPGYAETLMALGTYNYCKGDKKEE